ncbi:MAG: hypothetical protein WD513_03005, partial [Balneolaceae bacterium]
KFCKELLFFGSYNYRKRTTVTIEKWLGPLFGIQKELRWITATPFFCSKKKKYQELLQIVCQGTPFK